MIRSLRYAYVAFALLTFSFSMTANGAILDETDCIDEAMYYAEGVCDGLAMLTGTACDNTEYNAAFQAGYALCVDRRDPIR